MTEESASSPPARLPQVLGRLGLYATYVAAALVMLVIAGDLDVLVGHAPLAGLLAILVGAGPLVAMLLSTFASYVNYYGVWRVLRGKDEYDTGQDLKSHAADIPQAAQAALAGRAGCLPAASVVLLFIALLLAGAANVPPAMPDIGALGTWHDHVGALVSAASTPTPTALPTATATATATPTATATAAPTATATSTPGPVINFFVSPTTASWTGCTNAGPPPAKILTLDNSKSTVAVSWRASAREKLATGLPWATITPVASGTVAAGRTQSITVKPDPTVCQTPGPLWHVDIKTANAGSYTFTYTVS